MKIEHTIFENNDYTTIAYRLLVDFTYEMQEIQISNVKIKHIEVVLADKVGYTLDLSHGKYINVVQLMENQIKSDLYNDDSFNYAASNEWSDNLINKQIPTENV